MGFSVQDGNFTNILIAIFVIIVSLALFIFYRRRKSTKNCILLTGLCDSGKTLIFSQLLYERFVPTHTSIKENVGNYNVNESVLKIVDIPGHERLRHKFIEEYKEFTGAVVFVVDSLTIHQDVRDAAEFLYNILADVTLGKSALKIAILCNKQDQALSKGSKAIKSILEKELNTLRITKANQLESVDPNAKRMASLGSQDSDFSFSNLHLKIDFLETFAFNKDGSINIEELRTWLVNVV